MDNYELIDRANNVGLLKKVRGCGSEYVVVGNVLPMIGGFQYFDSYADAKEEFLRLTTKA